jgi:ATP-binding cassette subfamily B multidrug efflux pump
VGMRSIETIARTPREQAENRGATARRLLGELQPHWRSLVLALTLVALGAGAQAGGPWLIGRAIDLSILQGDVTGLLRTMLLLLGVYLVGTFASRGQIRQVGSVGQKVLASLRERIFEKLQRLPLGYFDRRPVGDLMSRVTNDVDTLTQLLSQGLTQLLGSFLA